MTKEEIRIKKAKYNKAFDECFKDVENTEMKGWAKEMKDWINRFGINQKED